VTARSLRLHSADNVAVALDDLAPGDRVTLEGISIEIIEPVPFAHKFATQAIKVGEAVTKYGETIGIATQPLVAGGHVHVHNVRSLRAAGSAG
jgi:altronate dehydratase